MQELLLQDGYAVDRTSTGEDILAAITASNPNLVLLDANISNINSFELLDKLKQGKHTGDVPVIFMTTLDDDESRVKGLESGDDHDRLRR